jgi:hypothetical protein
VGTVRLFAGLAMDINLLLEAAHGRYDGPDAGEHAAHNWNARAGLSKKLF